MIERLLVKWPKTRINQRRSRFSGAIHRSRDGLALTIINRIAERLHIKAPCQQISHDKRKLNGTREENNARRLRILIASPRGCVLTLIV